MTAPRYEPPRKTSPLAEAKDMIRSAWSDGPMSFAMFLLFVGLPLTYCAYSWVIQPLSCALGFELPVWSYGQ